LSFQRSKQTSHLRMQTHRHRFEAMTARMGIKQCIVLLLCLYNDTIYRYI
jgi:hypothetical protein